MPADVAALAALYHEAVAEVSPHRGGRALVGTVGRHEPVEDTFRAQLSDSGQAVVVVLREDGAVVGYGTSQARDLTTGERLGVIEELYVSTSQRRKGLGSAMTASLVAWCRHQGCTGVDAWALPGSRTVKSFYESRKFTARALVMHHQLSVDVPAQAREAGPLLPGQLLGGGSGS